MSEHDEYVEKAPEERSLQTRIGDLERRVSLIEASLAMLVQLKMYVDSDDRK